MPRLALAVPFLLIAAAALAGGLDEFLWREEFADARRFALQPTWLTNSSKTASVATDGKVACFRVDGPRRGMKWSASMPLVDLVELPWLVVRYRAQNLLKSDDYLIFLDDRVRDRQLHAIRLRDAVADGKWHTAAVDVTTLTRADAVHSFAVQVQVTDKGDARLWLDWLAFDTAPPDGAEIIRRAPVVPSKPDWTLPLDGAEWIHHDGWLGNPASKGKHSVERKGGVTLFRVAEPSRGMKWSWHPPKPAVLEGHRYVAMRYRATRSRPAGGYALCVIGVRAVDGSDYTAVMDPHELVADGRWHTVSVDIRAAAQRFPRVAAFAIQLQAAQPNATLEVAHIRLVNAVLPSKLADFIDFKTGARFDGFQPIPLGATARSESAAWRRHLRIADWFTAREITAQGIPFRLGASTPPTAPPKPIGPIRPIGPMATALAATGVRGKSELRIPANVSASEVYLLLLAAFIGPDEPCYGGGKLKAIRDVDRFRLRLEYADGTADECLPMQVPPPRREGESPSEPRFGIVEGPQLLVAAADKSKKLKAIILRDLSRQAAFALAALTAHTSDKPAFPVAREDITPLRLKPAGTKNARIATAQQVCIRNEAMEVSIRTDGPPLLERLVHRATGWDCLPRPCPLLELTVDGKRIPVERIRPFRVGRQNAKAFQSAYEVVGFDGLRLKLFAHASSRSTCVTAVVANHGSRDFRIGVTLQVGPYRLSPRTEETYYLLPRRGAVFDSRPCSFLERYCGLFPVQFLDTFSPSNGRGLSLSTSDLGHHRGLVAPPPHPQDIRWKHYILRKDPGGITIGVRTSVFPLKQGCVFGIEPISITATDGDWHRGFEAYRQWVRTWHKPLSPRKRWFREIFNFRQRFLHWLDPLYDQKTGTFHLQRAVDEARREFGGIDYLHIFDWGNCGKYGRIYGRTGDYSPYDYLKGGRDAFRKAIAGVQKQGIPTGLYIEGYLLTVKGKLGQKHGKDWQTVGPDGKGKWWPGNVEMSICAGVPAWREVQASTYEAKVKELGVDGMYIDQFGFANAGKDCFAKHHGHPVPSYCVRTERDATRIIRERVEKAKRNVAIYTEECPVDVTTQYQDGCFTYAMFSAQRTQTLVPLNIARFAFPDLKTIEILFCDKPTGSWATGVRWVFFNGEALWLEGPAAEWFEPETRAEIRRCYRILRKHKDAFTSLEPVPLVPTEMGGVFANKFPVKGKTVYTLYNSRHRTVRGVVLRLPHGKGTTYYDEWHQRAARIEAKGNHALVSLELGPHGVGCLVVKKE